MKKRNNLILGGIILTLVLVALLMFQVNGIKEQISKINSKLAPMESFFNAIKPGTLEPTTEPSAPTANGDLTDDDDVLGSPDAPVTIVEFSDFECPFCARFYNDAYQDIKEQYVDTGKVKIVFRDFPLGFHKQAQKASEAAECAGEQGQYYEMHDKLFEDGVSGGVSSFKQYAKDLNLDSNKFDECLDSGEMATEVQKDMADGSKAGVKGTPAFFINGNLLSGAQPFSAFQSVIEGELAK